MVRGAGLYGHWGYVRCHADACMGYDHRTARYACLAARAARDPVWRRCAAVYLADVGIFPEPRLLPVHHRIHDAIRIQRWQRKWIRQFAALVADREAEAGRCSANGSSQLGIRRLRGGQLAGASYRDAEPRAAL